MQCTSLKSGAGLFFFHSLIIVGNVIVSILFFNVYPCRLSSEMKIAWRTFYGIVERNEFGSLWEVLDRVREASLKNEANVAPAPHRHSLPSNIDQCFDANLFCDLFMHACLLFKSFN